MIAVDSVTISGGADSAYEYFLKQYLLTGHSDKESLDLRTCTCTLGTLV